MPLISEIENLQNKIRDSILKDLAIQSVEDLNAFIEGPEFKDFFKRFDSTKWNTLYYDDLKKEITKSRQKDINQENSDLVEAMSGIFSERLPQK